MITTTVLLEREYSTNWCGDPIPLGMSNPCTAITTTTLSLPLSYHIFQGRKNGLTVGVGGVLIKSLKNKWKHYFRGPIQVMVYLYSFWDPILL